MLSYNLLVVSEKGKQIAKVGAIVYVEAFPKVAAYHHTTKPQFLSHPHIVDVYPA